MGLVTETNRKWWTLAAVTFSLFMIMLDVTIVNVALPAIEADLDTSLSALQWTVGAYTLTYAVFLLTGGKLADFLGRRRIFLIGLAIFTVTSLVCALAGTVEVLIGARAAQGVGAALMLPATLSIISATFEPHERGGAIGIWAGVSALGLALGPLAGGLIIEGIDWRWIFYVNVPIGIVGVIVGQLVIRESKDTSHEQSLDLPGLVLSGVALFTLTYALIEGNAYGWTSARIVGCFVVTVVGFAAFVLFEQRTRLPMIEPALFRNSTFAGANVVGLMVMLTMFGILFFLSLYLQNVLRYTPLEAGATFLPMTLPLAFVQPVAGKVADRIGARWPMAAGMAVLSLSCLLLARVDENTTFWGMVPSLVLAGIGMGVVMTPMTYAVLGAVPVDKSGVASGILNTFRQAGGALGIAIMGAILTANIQGIAPGPELSSAFVDGLQDAFLLGAAITLVGTFVAAAMVRRTRPMGHAVVEPA
jgi:EmrB/QacA subfamily drug resistance transporter